MVTGKIYLESLDKADSERKLFKPNGINIQNLIKLILDLLLSFKRQNIKRKQHIKKVYTFRKEVTVLYTTTASHFMEKSPLKGPIVQSRYSLF